LLELGHVRECAVPDPLLRGSRRRRPRSAVVALEELDQLLCTVPRMPFAADRARLVAVLERLCFIAPILASYRAVAVQRPQRAVRWKAAATAMCSVNGIRVAMSDAGIQPQAYRARECGAEVSHQHRVRAGRALQSGIFGFHAANSPPVKLRHAYLDPFHIGRSRRNRRSRSPSPRLPGPPQLLASLNGKRVPRIIFGQDSSEGNP
jgi:hypothetical protein